MAGQILSYVGLYVLVALSFLVITVGAVFWSERKHIRVDLPEGGRDWLEFGWLMCRLLGFGMIWPIIIGSGIWSLISGRISEDFRVLREPSDEPWKPSIRQLDRAMTIAEAEQRGVIEDPLGAVPNLPFGHLNKLWRSFLEGVSLEASVWWFDTIGTDRWGSKHYAKGYALRAGREVERIFLTEFRPLDSRDW